jgi:GAF domain-containing protein
VNEWLRELSRVGLVDRTLTDVLTDITRIAVEGMPGSEATSITLIRNDKPFTAAHSGDMALAADELQYEHGYGPCIDAGRGGVLLRVDDMRTEERWPDYVAHHGEMALAADELQYEHGYGPCMDAGRGGVLLRVDDMHTEERWPDYVAHVVRTTPVRSSLSVPLPYQGSSIGALNIYSSEPAAFASPGSLRAGTDVAEVIAVAVANADAHAQLFEQARNMRLAMESRAVIEQAKGVLIAQRHVTAELAFETLREATQRYNRKLRDIAFGIVESTQPR